MFYSAETKGFYDPSINAEMPADACELPPGYHETLMAGQSAGRMIAPDESGYPVLVDYPTPIYSREEIEVLRRLAYQRESDPLKIEAEYDALLSGNPADYSQWIAKVSEIKARYPFPD